MTDQTLPPPPASSLFTWIYEGPHRNVYRVGDGDETPPVRPGSLEYKRYPSRGFSRRLSSEQT